ncbi:MAG: hypothetical protein RR137_09145 [Odoribacter sp.]
MKKVLFALILSVIGYSGFISAVAQKVTTYFQPYQWEQASLLAAREDKLILVEISDGGLGIDPKIEKGILNNSELMNFLHRNVIAIRIDINSPQGQEFLPRLLLTPYPVYAFFMPYGDLLQTIDPVRVAKNPSELQETFRKASESAIEKRSNSRSIRFHSETLPETLKQAKKTGRLVFIHLYADQNQADLLMEKNVFHLDRVADFYNAHFVNMRIKAKEAKDLIDRYGIKDYPTFLFLNAEGKLLYKAEKYSPAEQLIVWGQTALDKAKGIPFMSLSKEEAMKQAKQEGKLIFTDYYVAGNAHTEMLYMVFSDPEVTEFFRRHFVNISIESTQAALVFSDTNGRELHRVKNVEHTTDLLEEARLTLQGKGLAEQEKEYQAGNRQMEFLNIYTAMLGRAERWEEASRIVSNYLDSLPPDCLKEKTYWNLFYQYVTLADTKLLDYVLHHRKGLYTLYGEEEVRQKWTNLWIVGTDNFVNNGVLDEVGFKEYIKKLKKEKVKDGRLIIRNARIYIAEKTGDWRTYVELAEEKWNEEQISDAELYNFGVVINRECRNEAIRFKAANRFAQAAQKMERKEQISGKVNLSSYKGFFEKLVNDLISKK